MEQIIRSLSPFFLFNNRHCCPFVSRNDSFQPETDLIRFAHDPPLIYYGTSSSLLSERLNFEIVICYRIRFIIRMWMNGLKEWDRRRPVPLLKWNIIWVEQYDNNIIFASCTLHFYFVRLKKYISIKADKSLSWLSRDDAALSIQWK